MTRPGRCDGLNFEHIKEYPLNRVGRIPKASDVVVRELRDRILSGRLPVGHRLPSETELLEQFNLGRATIREGLRLLERDGLIEIKRGPGGGITVRHPDITQVSDAFAVLFAVQTVTLRDFLEFRMITEPQTAALAAARATEEDRKAIALAAEEPDFGRVVDLHVRIGMASGNGVVSNMLQALHSPFNAHFRESLVGKRHLEGTVRAHKRISERISQGDSDGARHAMEVHLEAYADYLERQNLLDDPIVDPRIWGSSFHD
ncbi:FadR/GntR family transcriptional regulator [uncultured Serinicoccus sp.]|uniref:FadR/GntR family transcriptional regulator n=1 Tax=uncultured Serinicoccus sp. TaxID=735514 RepID=UPI002628AB1B|nr:GntR family transcriptional regulator [uncultured Serinicoccus sp.]